MPTHSSLLKTVLPFLIVAVLSIMMSTTPASAGGRSSKKKPPAGAAVDQNDRITALHLTSVTVTLSSTHQSVEYKVNPATKITVNGQPAQLSGLAAGMDIKVTTAPNDPTSAVAIDATTAKK